MGISGERFYVFHSLISVQKNASVLFETFVQYKLLNIITNCFSYMSRPIVTLGKVMERLLSGTRAFLCIINEKELKHRITIILNSITLLNE